MGEVSKVTGAEEEMQPRDLTRRFSPSDLRGSNIPQLSVRLLLQAHADTADTHICSLTLSPR